MFTLVNQAPTRAKSVAISTSVLSGPSASQRFGSNKLPSADARVPRMSRGGHGDDNGLLLQPTEPEAFVQAAIWGSSVWCHKANRLGCTLTRGRCWDTAGHGGTRRDLGKTGMVDMSGHGGERRDTLGSAWGVLAAAQCRGFTVGKWQKTCIEGTKIQTRRRPRPG